MKQVKQPAKRLRTVTIQIPPRFTLTDLRIYGAVRKRTERLYEQAEGLAQFLVLSKEVLTRLTTETDRGILPKILDTLEGKLENIQATVSELKRMDQAARLMQKVAEE